MVNQALWRQIAALPVAERLDLMDAIGDSIPSVPDSVLPRYTPTQLRAFLDAQQHEIDHDPDGNLDAFEMLAELRAEFA